MVGLHEDLRRNQRSLREPRHRAHDEAHSNREFDRQYVAVSIPSLLPGVIVLVITNPIWMVKTRLQLQGTHKEIQPNFRPYINARGNFVWIQDF